MIEELLCNYCHRNMRDRRSDWCPMLHDYIWDQIALKDEVLHLSCAEELLGHKIENKHLKIVPFNAIGEFPHRKTLGITLDQFNEEQLKLIKKFGLGKCSL